MIRTFGDDIKNDDIKMDKANNEQNKLAQKITEFKINTKPRNPNMINEKSDVINNAMTLLTPKQMLQRLPIALAQVKSGNIFENLLNKLCQTIYSLYRATKITKKECNNIMNSIKL